MKVSIKRLFAAALLVRLVLIPLSYHSDLNNNAIWGIYAQEFGLRGFYDWLNFGNYARPDYPPLAMTLFLGLRWVWQAVFDSLWWVNINVEIFPSGLVTWFDVWGYKAILKLPGVAADMGIGYMIYSEFRKKNEGRARIAAAMFLYNPAVIYLSSSWGQLDGVVSLLALLAMKFALEKRYKLSGVFYFLSVMIKATFVPLAALLILLLIKQGIKLRRLVEVWVLVLVMTYCLGMVFIDSNPIYWVLRTYVVKIIPGAVTLPFINLNAFNFWGAVLGLERVSDGVLFLGIKLAAWGYGAGFLFIGLVLWRFVRGGNVYFSAVMLFYSIFMFFPRVHERYLYPVLVFMPFVFYLLPKIQKYYCFVSLVFLLNLYHWWWVPEISWLVTVLEAGGVERALSLGNLVLFMALFREYYWSKKRWSYR